MTDNVQHKSSRRGLHAKAIERLMQHLYDEPTQLPSMDSLAMALQISPAELHAVFPSQQDLVDAAAEEGLLLLIDSATKSVVKQPVDDPVAQFCSLGEAYLDWAINHRAYFLLTADRSLVDLANNPRLAPYHQAIRDLMQNMLERARDLNRLLPGIDIDLMLLGARGLAYGLGRLYLDKQVEEWLPGKSPEILIKRAMDVFVGQVFYKPPKDGNQDNPDNGSAT